MSTDRLSRLLLVLVTTTLLTSLPWLLATATPSATGLTPSAFSCATVSEIARSECEALVSFFNATPA